MQALARYVYRFVFVYYAYGNFSAVYADRDICADCNSAICVEYHFACYCKVCVCIVYRNCIVLRFNYGNDFFDKPNYLRYAYVCICIFGNGYDLFRCRHTKLYAEHACRKALRFTCIPERNIAKFELYFPNDCGKYRQQFVAVYYDTYAVFRKAEAL